MQRTWKAVIGVVWGVTLLFSLVTISCRRSAQPPPATQPAQRTTSTQPAQPAKPTGSQQVVVYCSVDQEVAEPILAQFEKQTGIKVLAKYDQEAVKTVGLVQRLANQKDAPEADVFWSNEVFHMIRCSRQGLLAGYSGPSTRDWPARYADKQGLWHGFALRARVIAYSTARVKPADAPRTLTDLLDAKWKGRIAMAQPQFGTTGGDVASWFVHLGADKAQAILRALRDNDVRMVAGNSVAVRMVANGQADLCLTDTDDVYAAQRNGQPIAMNYLLLDDVDGRKGGVLTIPNTAGLVAGAPHPAQAAALLEFLLSKDLEATLLASDSHNTPVRAPLEGDLSKYEIPQPLAIDYAAVAEQLPAALAKAREILP